MELREPGAILLISCYELGHQPMGLAMPMAFLEQAGYRPFTLELPVEGWDAGRVRHARFAGISVPMHTALRLGVRAAERIRRENPRCHICFYGIYALLNAEYLLEHVADTVIGGEYEEPLLRLVQSMHQGKEDAIQGVGRRGEIPVPYLRRLSFPVPVRSTLPALRHYARLESSEAKLLAGYVEATRGCKHLCLHCPIPPVYHGRFFAVPQEVVLEDIRRLAEAGARHITFGDPDFLNGPTHSLRIVRTMRERFPHLTFDFTAKVEHLLKYRSLLREFAGLGCIFIVSAVESLSDTVLANLEKGHTRADVYEALRVVRGAGIVLRPSLLAFTPWTTLDDYIEMLGFVESEGLTECIDLIQYAVRLLIPPGSALLSRSAIHPYLGALAPETLSYSWRHPDARMDALHERVTVLVGQSVAEGAEDYLTFLRIKELALAVRDDRPAARVAQAPQAFSRKAPRLTEPWFC